MASPKFSSSESAQIQHDRNIPLRDCLSLQAVRKSCTRFRELRLLKWLATIPSYDRSPTRNTPSHVSARARDRRRYRCLRLSRNTRLLMHGQAKIHGLSRQRSLDRREDLTFNKHRIAEGVPRSEAAAKWSNR